MFEKSLSNILPGEMGVVLGLEDQRYYVDFGFSLMKCWRSSKLIEESMLEIFGKFSLLPGMPLINKISLRRTMDSLRFIYHIMSKTSLYFV